MKENKGASDCRAELERWTKLGDNGFAISICYGPCGNNGPMFSVNVLTRDFQSFEKPFAARTLAQALDIAEIEIRERGWGAINH